MNQPKVGVGVYIFKDGKLLLGKRKGSHGEGEYATPGGKLENLESITDCAIREVAEETGLQIKNIRFLRVSNILNYAPKHYVDIAMIADWESGEPKILEPDKVESWDWYDLNHLPSPLFATMFSAIDSLKTGNIFYE